MTTTRRKPAAGPDYQTLIRKAVRAERVVTLCLQGDLVAEFYETAEALVEAKKRATQSFDGGSEVAELVAKVEALQERMRADSYRFRMRGLPKPKWRALIAAHPPRQVVDEETGERKLEEEDAELGLNPETFQPALIRACLVDPALDEDGWAELEEQLIEPQMDALVKAAWAANRSDISLPFSWNASSLRQVSEDE